MRRGQVIESTTIYPRSTRKASGLFITSETNAVQARYRQVSPAPGPRLRPRLIHHLIINHWVINHLINKDIPKGEKMKRPRDTNMSRGHGSESWDSDGVAPVTIRIGLVRRRGLEPLHLLRRQDLNLVRLPISPPARQLPTRGKQAGAHSSGAGARRAARRGLDCVRRALFFRERIARIAARVRGAPARLFSSAGRRRIIRGFALCAPGCRAACAGTALFTP